MKEQMFGRHVSLGILYVSLYYSETLKKENHFQYWKLKIRIHNPCSPIHKQFTLELDILRSRSKRLTNTGDTGINQSE